MEYLKVVFDPQEQRDVLANGNVIGQTDTVITLPADFYRLTLSGAGYTPAFWEGQVASTSIATPLQVRFTHAQ